jgi:hypothetical protein
MSTGPVLADSVRSVNFGGHLFTYGIDQFSRQLDYQIDNNNWQASADKAARRWGNIPLSTARGVSSLSVNSEGDTGNGAVEVFAIDELGTLWVDTTRWLAGQASHDSGFLPFDGFGAVSS